MAAAVGILGGTFDPVHDTHLAIARLALGQLGLEKILWLPTGSPGYRKPPVAAGEDRLAMLKLALAGEPRYAIDARELEPGASGHTFDSLCALKRENPRTAYVLILGSDQWEKRAGWHRWPDLEKLAAPAVVARPGSQVDGAPRRLAMPPSALSASDIRARIARGEDVTGMVPAAVLDYIRRKGLYH